VRVCASLCEYVCVCVCVGVGVCARVCGLLCIRPRAKKQGKSMTCKVIPVVLLPCVCIYVCACV